VDSDAIGAVSRVGQEMGVLDGCLSSKGRGSFGVEFGASHCKKCRKQLIPFFLKFSAYASSVHYPNVGECLDSRKSVDSHDVPH